MPTNRENIVERHWKKSVFRRDCYGTSLHTTSLTLDKSAYGLRTNLLNTLFAVLVSRKS